jgi:hypothetical protein
MSTPIATQEVRFAILVKRNTRSKLRFGVIETDFLLDINTRYFDTRTVHTTQIKMPIRNGRNNSTLHDFDQRAEVTGN